MALVAGVDSSTQSCKVVIVDTLNGRIVREGSAPHPSGTEVDPESWWDALQSAIYKAGGLEDVRAISVAGQQHGLVCLDADGKPVRPAILWNDTRSAPQALALINELGYGSEKQGTKAWVEATGSAPVASLTVTKVRWLVENEPENAQKIKAICLPHDYLTWKLLGSGNLEDLVTDRSDASGTGYVDCETGTYRPDLLSLAFNGGIKRQQLQNIILPRIAKPTEQVGVTGCVLSTGVCVAPGCGDNAGAALGLGLHVGQAFISLGTSGVVAAVANTPVKDLGGNVSGFMDASGNWLPLACTLNASRIIDAMKTALGVDYAQFDNLALRAPVGAEGVYLTPYFEGERTPNLPDATATLGGLTLQNTTPANIARAAVEGLATLMKGALEVLQSAGCRINRAKLLGGGAASVAVQHIMPEVLGIDVDVVPTHQYVALGAAKQAQTVLQNN